jgi:hypothetical protein
VPMKKTSWLVTASIATIVGLFDLLSSLTLYTDRLSGLFQRHEAILATLAVLGGLGVTVTTFVLARKEK